MSGLLHGSGKGCGLGFAAELFAGDTPSQFNNFVRHSGPEPVYSTAPAGPPYVSGPWTTGSPSIRLKFVVYVIRIPRSLQDPGRRPSSAMLLSMLLFWCEQQRQQQQQIVRVGSTS
jgi:hypothetical protein